MVRTTTFERPPLAFPWKKRRQQNSSTTLVTGTNGWCPDALCGAVAESDRHAVAVCPAAQAARARFQQATGVCMTPDTYCDIMALDGVRLGVPGPLLASALFRLLADVYRRRYRRLTSLTTTSVAHISLDNQRRTGTAGHTRQLPTTGIT